MKVYEMSSTPEQLKAFSEEAVPMIARGGRVVLDVTLMVSNIIDHLTAAQNAANNRNYAESQRIIAEHLTAPFGFDVTEMLTEVIAGTCERLHLFMDVKSEVPS